MSPSPTPCGATLNQIPTVKTYDAFCRVGTPHVSEQDLVQNVGGGVLESKSDAASECASADAKFFDARERQSKETGL
ncbi:hypothetical protein GMORB2_3850 [Geosmithia morbida]|uniref:Uncharacterized protein n=1 Tax=Geosmithia morbida TaxID=1094350 RepID=A0A9P5D5X3_9HYPO|nr:uncharacterized protein GMORB2_3850 [Geosmithia morbida]KAF4125011.1 hypothetical protein GMORB2_3850 [Geosmithia morbida]